MLMKAVAYTCFGAPDVLEPVEVDTPVPGQQEVLVKIQAAAINFGDWAFLRGKPFLVRLMGAGLRTPKYPILGSDIAGRVEAVGPGVEQFQPGDEVFGDVSEAGWGGFAEYDCVPEDAIAKKPANVPFEDAAASAQAAVVALQGLRDVGGLRAGQKVLITGASGGIGTFAVQIAKAAGGRVTGVCGTSSLDLVRSLGADHVIDYTKEDFARGGETYDLVLAAGGYRSIYDYRRALAPRGTYVMSGGSMAQVYEAMFLGPFLSKRGGQTLRNLSARPKQEDLRTIAELLSVGKIKPVIDRRYALSEVSEALRHYGTGHAHGKVIVRVDGQA
jgi:NADPH:quinone reductase-like Zn-dependent oxidoreductase